MSVRLHRALLMFLVLLLPVQAFAAARLAGCMIAPRVAEHVAPQPAGHCHDTVPDPHQAQPMPHTCSHCVACALASALPIPVATRLPALPATLVPAVAGIAPFTGFIPDGPERPPRSHLA